MDRRTAAGCAQIVVIDESSQPDRRARCDVPDCM